MASIDRLKEARNFCYYSDVPHSNVHQLMADFADKVLDGALSIIKDGRQPYGKLRKEQWEKSNEKYDLEEITHVPTRTAWMLGFDACADLLRELLAKD